MENRSLISGNEHFDVKIGENVLWKFCVMRFEKGEGS